MDGEGLRRRGVDVVLFFGVFAIERSCRSERKKSGRKKRESEKRSLFFEKKKHGNFKEQNSIPLSLTSCGDLAYSTSTGNVLPGIWNTGASPKKAAKRAASSVAEVTTSRKSLGLRAATALSTPNRTSVLSERSWASSMMMAE